MGFGQNVNTGGYKPTKKNTRTPGYQYLNPKAHLFYHHARVLMNDNNPNLNAKYEEDYQIKQTPDVWKEQSNTRLEIPRHCPWVSLF